MGSKTNAAGFVTDWTPMGLDPKSDYIYGYSGEKGKRVTDWEEIKRGLLAGDIKTDVGKMMESWQSMGDGKISKRMGPADYEQGALGQWLKVNWRTGNVNPTSFSDGMMINLGGGGDSGGDGRWGKGDLKGSAGMTPKDRVDSLAKYIGAVNTRMNIADNETELAHLTDELDALNTNRKRKQEYESGLKGSSGVRYKRALMGSLRTNNSVPGLYYDKGYAITESGDIMGFPSPNPPTYP